MTTRDDEGEIARAPDPGPPSIAEEYRPRPGAFLGMAAFGGVVGVSLAYTGWLIIPHQKFLGAILVGQALVLGGTVVAWLARLRRSGPSLVLSDEGILDASHLGPATFIPWSEIRAVRTEAGVTVALLDENHHVEIPLFRRLTQWLRRRPADEYLLPTVWMDAPAAEIAHRIGDHHEQRLLAEVRAAASIGESEPESRGELPEGEARNVAQPRAISEPPPPPT